LNHGEQSSWIMFKSITKIFPLRSKRYGKIFFMVKTHLLIYCRKPQNKRWSTLEPPDLNALVVCYNKLTHLASTSTFVFSSPSTIHIQLQERLSLMPTYCMIGWTLFAYWWRSLHTCLRCMDSWRLAKNKTNVLMCLLLNFVQISW